MDHVIVVSEQTLVSVEFLEVVLFELKEHVLCHIVSHGHQ
jgi:hypothetical protein